MKAKDNTKTLSQLIDEHYIIKGTPKMNKFGKSYETIKSGVLNHEARLEKV